MFYLAVLHTGKILNHREVNVKAKAMSTEFEAESHGSMISTLQSQVTSTVEIPNLAYSSW